VKIVVHNCETGQVEEVELSAEQEAEHNRLGQLEGWAKLRRERNAILAETDWTVMSDTPTNTAAWKAYRQALRDLPANTTDPFNAVWPTPPA